MAPGNLQAEWARLLLTSLVDAGVSDAVVSPGSRSTPFVLAAAQHPKLRVVDIIDERSAAYFALGQARVTGRPTLLIATSGTAGANYFPAVVEAGAARVPVVVLTADRPVELVACGANQTIDQIKLYGGHAREFFDLGAPDATPRALRALRRVASQAVFASRHPSPGAVHLNVRARKPLEPGVAESQPELELVGQVDGLLARPVPVPIAPRLMPESGAIEELAKVCLRSRRGLIVCGPAPLSQAGDRSLIAELARRTGYPLLREAASQVRFCSELNAGDLVTVDSFDALLQCQRFRETVSPQLILQIGAFPVSAAWARYLASYPECRHWVLGSGAWSDAQSTASELLFADLDLILARLTTRLRPHSQKSDWSALWSRADAVARDAIELELAAGKDGLSEGRIARALAGALPAGSLMALGNSLPIREMNTYGLGGEADFRIWSQRGASGIDGVLSGVFGAASRWLHRVALFVGDVSFLHDLSGLHAARHVEVPVVIVVAQNHGGRIFEQLPLARHSAAREDMFGHWTTPHDLDLAPAAALYGLDYQRVEALSELEQALVAGFERTGVTVIEAVVPPHGAADQSRRLATRIDSAFAEAREG